jgi:predicted nuclease of predicted toxin-antitoxin system
MSRFLADENFPGACADQLRALGHDVFWARTDAPGTPDRTLLARAVSDQRVVLTFDKDFGELAFRFRLPAACGIVLFRLPMSRPAIMIDLIVRTITSRDDWTGRYHVVEPGRIRERSL